MQVFRQFKEQHTVLKCSEIALFWFIISQKLRLKLISFGTRKAEELNRPLMKITPNENDITTYCKHFDNSCYYHQCIAN